MIDIVNHHQVEPIIKENTTDGEGYGKGFHTLSDVISHILNHRRTSRGRSNNTFHGRNLRTASSSAGLHTPAAKRATLPIGQRSRHNQKLSHQINEPMFPVFERNDTFSMGHRQFSTSRTKHKLDLRKISQSKHNASPFNEEKGDVIFHVESSNRLSVDPGHDVRGKNSASVRASKTRNSESSYHRYDLIDDGYRGSNRKNQSFSALKSMRDKRRKIRKGRPSSKSRLQRGPGHKMAPAVNKATQEPFPPVVRLFPRTHGHDAIGTRVNSTKKIRNLRRQLARIRAKLNRYLRLAHPRKGKTPSHLTSNSADQ